LKYESDKILTNLLRIKQEINESLFRDSILTIIENKVLVSAVARYLQWPE